MINRIIDRLIGNTPALSHWSHADGTIDITVDHQSLPALQFSATDGPSDPRLSTPRMIFIRIHHAGSEPFLYGLEIHVLSSFMTQLHHFRHHKHIVPD